MSFSIDNSGLSFAESDSKLELELRKRVLSELKSRGISPRANTFFWVKAATWLSLTLFFYWQIFQFPHSKGMTLLMAILYGLSSLYFVLNISHDAAHGAVVKSKRANDLLHFFTFNILGVNSYLWQMRHLHSHHVFPNVLGCDADIDYNPIIRLSPEHKGHWYQRWQHLYAPFIYLVVQLHSIFVQDPIYLFKKDLANLTSIKHSTGQKILFIFGKLQFLTIALVLPLLWLPYSTTEIVIGFFIVTSLMSLAFVLPLIGTHFNDTAEFPATDEEMKLPTSYFRHQIESSLDWKSRSHVASFFYAGLNAHIAHHLFARVNHVHYPLVSEITYEFLREKGIPYHEVGFRNAVASHFRFLKRMGLRES